jgi:hypothetical protein
VNGALELGRALQMISNLISAKISVIASTLMLISITASVAAPKMTTNETKGYSSNSTRANALRYEYEHGASITQAGSHPMEIYPGHDCLLREYARARGAGLSHDDAYTAACGYCPNVC